jgi:hypothetical protein
MKTIRVGFSTHTGAFSWLIRTATASKVSHTYLRIPVPEYNTSMIFQASGLTVNYCAAEVFDLKNHIYEEYEVDVSDEQYEVGEKFRVTEAGKSYSMKQVCGFATVLAARQLLNKRIPNPYSNGNHSYVCVEVVTVCIGLADGESMTPEDLRRWCEKNAKLVYKKPL